MGPSRREYEDQMCIHIPYRDWCPHCVRGKAPNAQHRRHRGYEDEKVNTERSEKQDKQSEARADRRDYDQKGIKPRGRSRILIEWIVCSIFLLYLKAAWCSSLEHGQKWKLMSDEHGPAKKNFKPFQEQN